MSKSLIMKVRLFLVALMTVAFVLGAGIFTLSAKAEGEFSIKQITYEMDGASIRIGESDGVNGLKFTAKMSKTDYARIGQNVGEGKTYSSIEYGVLIMPDYYANYYALDEKTVFGEGGEKVYDWAELVDGEWVYTGDNTLPAAGGHGVRIINIYTNEWIEGPDKFTYSGSIVEIKDGSVGGVNNLAQEMYSKAYIKATKADGSVDYLFSSNFKCMSAAYVAQKTIEMNTLTPEQNQWLQANYIDKAQADFEASLIKGGDLLVNVEKVADLKALDLTAGYIDPEHLEAINEYQRFATTYELKGYSIADEIKVTDLTKVDVSSAKRAAYTLNVKVGDTIVYTALVDLYNTTDKVVWAESLTEYNVVLRRTAAVIIDAYYTATVNATPVTDFEFVNSYEFNGKTYTGDFIKYDATEDMNLSVDIKALHSKAYYNAMIGDSTKVLHLRTAVSETGAGTDGFMQILCGANNSGVGNAYTIRGRQGVAAGLESIVLSMDNMLIANSGDETYHGYYYDWDNPNGTNVGMCSSMLTFEVTDAYLTGAGGTYSIVAGFSGDQIVDAGETLVKTLATSTVDLVSNESFDLINLLPEGQHAKFKAMAALWVGKSVTLYGVKRLTGNAVGFQVTINGTMHCVVANANGEAILHRDDYIVDANGTVSNTTRVRDLLTVGENSVTVNGFAPTVVSLNGFGQATRLMPLSSTITIVWDELAVHTVTFDGNGGTLVSGTEVQEIENGGAAEAPVYTKDRHIFAGWDKTFDVVTESMTVTAQWTPIVYHNVTFDGNGGTLVSGSALQEIENGLSATAPTFEREGYVFLGFDKTFDVITEDITVTAKWLKQTAISGVSLYNVTGNGDFDLANLLDEETKAQLNALSGNVVLTLTDNNGNVIDLSENWTLDFTDYSALRVWKIQFKYEDIVFYTNTIDFTDDAAPFIWNDFSENSGIENALKGFYPTENKSTISLGSIKVEQETFTGSDGVARDAVVISDARGYDGNWKSEVFFSILPIHSKEYYESYLEFNPTVKLMVYFEAAAGTAVTQYALFGNSGFTTGGDGSINKWLSKTNSLSTILNAWDYIFTVADGTYAWETRHTLNMFHLYMKTGTMQSSGLRMHLIVEASFDPTIVQCVNETQRLYDVSTESDATNFDLTSFISQEAYDQMLFVENMLDEKVFKLRSVYGGNEYVVSDPTSFDLTSIPNAYYNFVIEGTHNDTKWDLFKAFIDVYDSTKPLVWTTISEDNIGYVKQYGQEHYLKNSLQQPYKSVTKDVTVVDGWYKIGFKAAYDDNVMTVLPLHSKEYYAQAEGLGVNFTFDFYPEINVTSEFKWFGYGRSSSNMRRGFEISAANANGVLKKTVTIALDDLLTHWDAYVGDVPVDSGTPYLYYDCLLRDVNQEIRGTYTQNPYYYLTGFNLVVGAVEPATDATVYPKDVSGIESVDALDFISTENKAFINKYSVLGITYKVLNPAGEEVDLIDSTEIATVTADALGTYTIKAYSGSVLLYTGSFNLTLTPATKDFAMVDVNGFDIFNFKTVDFLGQDVVDMIESYSVDPTIKLTDSAGGESIFNGMEIAINDSVLRYYETFEIFINDLVVFTTSVDLYDSTAPIVWNNMGDEYIGYVAGHQRDYDSTKNLQKLDTISITEIAGVQYFDLWLGETGNSTLGIFMSIQPLHSKEYYINAGDNLTLTYSFMFANYLNPTVTDNGDGSSTTTYASSVRDIHWFGTGGAWRHGEDNNTTDVKTGRSPVKTITLNLSDLIEHWDDYTEGVPNTTNSHSSTGPKNYDFLAAVCDGTHNGNTKCGCGSTTHTGIVSNMYISAVAVGLGQIQAVTDATVYPQEVFGIESVDALDFITDENKAFISQFDRLNVNYKLMTPAGQEVTTTEISTLTAGALGTYTIKAYAGETLLYTGYFTLKLTALTDSITKLINVNGLSQIDLKNVDIIAQNNIDVIEEYSNYGLTTYRLTDINGNQFTFNSSVISLGDVDLCYYEKLEVLVNDLVIYSGSIDLYDGTDEFVWNTVSEENVDYIKSFYRNPCNSTNAGVENGTTTIVNIGGVDYFKTNFTQAGGYSGNVVNFLAVHSKTYYEIFYNSGYKLAFDFYMGYDVKAEDGVKYEVYSRDYHYFGQGGYNRPGVRDLKTSAETGISNKVSVSLSLDLLIEHWTDINSIPNDRCTTQVVYDAMLVSCSYVGPNYDPAVNTYDIYVGNIRLVAPEAIVETASADVATADSVDLTDYVGETALNRIALLESFGKELTYVYTAPSGDTIDSSVITNKAYATLGDYVMTVKDGETVIYTLTVTLTNSDYVGCEEVDPYSVDFATVENYDLSTMLTAVSERIDRISAYDTISYVLVDANSQEKVLDNLTLSRVAYEDIGVYTLKLIASDVVLYQGSINVTNSDYDPCVDEKPYSVDFATADSFYITSMFSAVSEKIDRISAYDTISYVLVKGEETTELTDLIVEPSTYAVVGTYTVKVLASDVVIYQGSFTIDHTGYETVSMDDTEYFIDLTSEQDTSRFNLASKLSAETIARINKIAQYDNTTVATITDLNGNVTTFNLYQTDVGVIYLDIVDDYDLRYYYLEIKASDMLLAYNHLDIYKADGAFLWNDEISIASVDAVAFEGDDKVRKDFDTYTSKAPELVEIEGATYIRYSNSGGNGTWFAWKPLHTKAYYELYKGIGVELSATLKVDASGIVNLDDKDGVLNQKAMFGAGGASQTKVDVTYTDSATLDKIIANWDAFVGCEWDRTWDNRAAAGMVYVYNVHNGGKILVGDFKVVVNTDTVDGGDVLVNVDEAGDLTALDLTTYIGDEGMAIINAYKPFGLTYQMKGYSIADTIEVTDLESVDVFSAKRAAYTLNVKVGDTIVYTADVDLYNTTDTVVWAESLTTDNVIARKLGYSTDWPSKSTGRVEYEIVDTITENSKTGSFIKFTVTEAMNIALDIKALHTKAYYNELVGDSNKIFFVNTYYPSDISLSLNGGRNNAGIHNAYSTWRTGTGSGWDNIVLSLDNYLIARNANDSITGKWYNWNNIEGSNAGQGNTMVQFEVSSAKASAEAPFVFYVGISKGTGTIVEGGETLATADQINNKVVNLSTETSYNLADLLPELSQPKFKAMAKAWIGMKIDCCSKIIKGNGIGFVLTINGTKHVIAPNADGEAMLNLDDYVIGLDGVVSTTTLVRDLLTPGENSVSIIGYAKSGNLGGHSTTFLPTSTIKVIAPEAVAVEELSYSNGTSKYMQTENFTANSVNDGNLAVMYTDSVQDYSKTAKVSAFKNDVEAIQLQVVPSVDVGKYSFKVKDLTSGGNVLPASAFSVFHQLYTEVLYLSSAATPTPTGTYPDALLPYDVAFNNNLNTMKANVNQGIWINVEIPADQPAGVYTGTFWLIMGLSKYEIPVEVTVFDYAISDDTYMITSFGLGYTDLLNLETEGEYDEEGNLILTSSGNKTGTVPQELINAYSDFLSDYRIGFSPIVEDTTFSTAWRGFPYDPKAILSTEKVTINGKEHYAYEYPLRKFDENKEVVIYTGGYTIKDTGKVIQSYPLNYQKLDAYFAQMFEMAKDPNQGGYRLPVQQGIASNFNYDNVHNPELYPFEAPKTNGWQGQMCEIRDDIPNGERYNTILTLTLRDSVEYFFLKAVENYQETGILVDIFEKAFVWPVWTDEYSNVPGKIANAQYLLKYMKDFFPQLADWIEFKHKVTDENVLAMLDSLADVRVVVTGQDTDPFDPDTQWAEFITTPNNYHSQEQRDEIEAWANSIYNGHGNQWIYTALTPHPYASYLVESPLLTSRLLGWQMGHYDIANMLYWTTMSSKYLDGIIFSAKDENTAKNHKKYIDWLGKSVEDGEIIDVADFYKQAIHYGSAAGDGFMIYPGSYFGVTGPISSIRMEAIRDSIEDNNLLVDLRTMYELAGHDKGFYNVMDRLTELVYTGVHCKTQAGYVSAFETSRQTLASMLVLARDYNIFVEDVYMDDGGDCKYSIIYPESLKAQIGTDADEAVLINGAAGFRRVFTATSDETISFSFADQEIVLSIKVLVESAEISEITFTPNGYNYHASYDTNNESKKVEVEEVNLATENGGAGVGGRTEGEYFLVSQTQQSYKTNFGISVLPLETKEYYEQYAENAVLEFDVYIEAYTLEGAPVNAFNLYYRLGNSRNTQHTTFKWFTVRINLSTLIENWDNYHLSSGHYDNGWSAADRALFVVNGAAYERLSRFYIGNFKFTHI